MRPVRIGVLAGWTLLAGCESTPATMQPASSPAIAPIDAGSAANDDVVPPPAPPRASSGNITVENQSGDPRFDAVARAAMDQRLEREWAALQRYVLVVIIQPFEIDGADLRARLVARVSDAATGRLVGEIPVSLKLAGGAADRAGPAAEELVAQAATRIADQLAAYFSKASDTAPDAG